MTNDRSRSRKKTSRSGRKRNGAAEGPVRYAVAGLGWIAQSAVLPAFEGARSNSKLEALVSDDATKLRSLGSKYKVGKLYSYDELDRCLEDPDLDAVFIALPNTMHRAYTEAAARAGKHVLCEKPMAMTELDCRAMVDTCKRAGVRLMIGYRLHFEKANLAAAELVQSGRIGEPRIFDSVFVNDVEEGNLRLRGGEGGPLYDIGIYCLNAARSIFRAEPVEVSAWHESRSGDRRFAEVPEMTSARLRFPGDRLASFVCSFGGSSASRYSVVGTKGVLSVDPAFSIGEDLVHTLTIKDKTSTTTFGARDHFAPELLEFSDCVLRGREPEPSGEEGLADVRVLQALDESARAGGRAMKLAPFKRTQYPRMDQEIRRPLGKKPRLVHAQDPTPAR
jgi:glucose-fructose oxidoreductase